MIKIYCNEVQVKFKSQRNTQTIRFSEGPTTTKKICFTDDGVRLSVHFMDRNGFVTKLIGFPMHDVVEYSCSECDTPTTVEPGTKPVGGPAKPAATQATPYEERPSFDPKS